MLTIKSLLSSEKFKYWPIVSLAHYAQRKGLLNIHLSTFYKYARLLGIKRAVFKRPKPKDGIRASGIHQIWHTDITIIKLNGVKFYLHLLVDNFSRSILSWRIKKDKSGKTVVSILKESVKKFNPGKVVLLTDAGTENINGSVNRFQNRKINSVERVIA